MKIFLFRIFWKVSVTEGGEGYYYYTWHNWFLNITEVVFAGYTRKVLISKDSAFDTIMARIKDGEKSKSMSNGRITKR